MRLVGIECERPNPVTFATETPTKTLPDNDTYLVDDSIHVECIDGNDFQTQNFYNWKIYFPQNIIECSIVDNRI